MANPQGGKLRGAYSGIRQRSGGFRVEGFGSPWGGVGFVLHAVAGQSTKMCALFFPNYIVRWLGYCNLCS
jgi:hypothetical protein